MLCIQIYLCNLSTKLNQRGQNYKILLEIWIVIIIPSSFERLQVILEKFFYLKHLNQ